MLEYPVEAAGSAFGSRRSDVESEAAEHDGGWGGAIALGVQSGR